MIKDDITVMPVREYNDIMKIIKSKGFDKKNGYIAIYKSLKVYAGTYEGALNQLLLA